jgi:hypothetical protein
MMFSKADLAQLPREEIERLALARYPALAPHVLAIHHLLQDPGGREDAMIEACRLAAARATPSIRERWARIYELEAAPETTPDLLAELAFLIEAAVMVDPPPLTAQMMLRRPLPV